ncbi:MAG: succinate--CoA ligase subunit alpha [Clostridia bacterium]|nr:succinate--CoA ligase subunit alpha [Clostridia bacterium]
MSIFVGKGSRVIVQGITGKAARFHTKEMLAYGTQIVAGVSPDKSGSYVEGVPVFATVEQAVANTKANVSIIYVPAAYAAEAIIEAVMAGIELIVCITEHIPVKDMIGVKAFMSGKKARLIGPNCPGIITPGETKIGIMPGYIHEKGPIGIVSRSGTLTYEAVHQISHYGIGQSTAIGIGGDPIIGTTFLDVLKAFNEDDETKAVVMIGEIGGDAEEEAAKWIKEHMKKPVIAYISGMTAPQGKRMGHAGAIISGGKGTASEKVRILELAGIPVSPTPSLIGATLVEELIVKGLWGKAVVPKKSVERGVKHA